MIIRLIQTSLLGFGRRLGIYYLKKKFPDCLRSKIFAIYGPPEFRTYFESAIGIVADCDSDLMEADRFAREIVIGCGADKITGSAMAGILVITDNEANAEIGYLVALVVYLAKFRLEAELRGWKRHRPRIHDFAISETRAWLAARGIEGDYIDAFFGGGTSGRG